MKKWKLVAVLILVLVGISLYFAPSFQKNSTELKKEATTSQDSMNTQVPKKNNPIKEAKKDSSSSLSNIPLKDIVSMTKEEGQRAMQDVMMSALAKGSTVEDLIGKLKSFKSNPSINREGDESFGHVYTIALKKSFPGTRNFYAQFEGAPGASPRAQRISYELPPGPESIALAKEFFDSIPGLEKVVEESEDFSRVQYNDGRHCWYKVMDEEWIAQPNPLHAYSKEDIGTVVVVCEDDIHPHMDGTNDSHDSHEGHGH